MEFKPIAATVVLLVMVVSLLVAGCTQTTTQSVSSPSPTQSPNASVAQPTNQATNQATTTVGNSNLALIIEDPGEEVINHMQISAAATTVPQQISTYTPKTGYKFVGFNCTVKNINAAPNQETSAGYWYLRDTTGHVYDIANATFALANIFDTVRTQPGDVVNGVIVFEVPQNAQLKSLTYDYGS
jgi:uncharacterized protein YceK